MNPKRRAVDRANRTGGRSPAAPSDSSDEEERIMRCLHGLPMVQEHECCPDPAPSAPHSSEGYSTSHSSPAPSSRLTSDAAHAGRRVILNDFEGPWQHLNNTTARLVQPDANTPDRWSVKITGGRAAGEFRMIHLRHIYDHPVNLVDFTDATDDPVLRHYLPSILALEDPDVVMKGASSESEEEHRGPDHAHSTRRRLTSRIQCYDRSFECCPLCGLAPMQELYGGPPGQYGQFCPSCQPWVDREQRKLFPHRFPVSFTSASAMTPKWGSYPLVPHLELWQLRNPVLMWHQWNLRMYLVSAPGPKTKSELMACISQLWVRAKRMPSARVSSAAPRARMTNASLAAAYCLTLNETPYLEPTREFAHVIDNLVPENFLPPCNWCGCPTARLSKCNQSFSCQSCASSPFCCRTCA